MISLYKLKREINRIQLQILGVFSFYTDKIKALLYDRNWKNLIQLSDGSSQSNSNKYAIFVIYQKISLAKSIFETCNDLLRKNYKVLIISNASINSSDIFQLRKYVWRICIRPNFGYDFGAYRDGIRLLVEWKISPDRLIMMNDSIWFPFLMMSAVAVVTLGLFPGVTDREVRKTLGLIVRHLPQTVLIVHMSLRQAGRTDG